MLRFFIFLIKKQNVISKNPEKRDKIVKEFLDLKKRIQNNSLYEKMGETNLQLDLENFLEIRIDVLTQDIYTLPSEAYLLFEGQLVKFADGTAYANTDAVTLTKNGIMHLFREISYQLSNQNVETINHQGKATTMLRMLKYLNDFQLAQGLNQLWYKDTATTAVLTDNSGFALRKAYIIQKPTTKGTFSFCIPLRHIFGFCYDYDKVIFDFKHTITLVRKTDYDEIFKLSTVADAKVNLNKISLFIPHVLPADAERFKLFNQIASKTNIPVCYCQRQCDTISVQQSTRFSWDVCTSIGTERPRYVIVAFQTNKSGDQNTNPSIFDHCDLSNIYISLNSERYPAVDYNLSFPNQQFSRAYRDAADRDDWYR
ncbi:uncharacterized protein LOC136087891 [Hydra vulgaris]|uniref:Uncharacterized protein LOC136087891 n=1 Tax=Hydra vulgaris TaxID=6087 RepID=A0ABM4D025_HYDVU